MVKVGDIVTIRKDLVVDHAYGMPFFAKGMKPYLGTQQVVYRVLTDRFYLVGIDYSWTEEMLEKKSKIIEVW